MMVVMIDQSNNLGMPWFEAHPSSGCDGSTQRRKKKQAPGQHYTQGLRRESRVRLWNANSRCQKPPMRTEKSWNHTDDLGRMLFDMAYKKGNSGRGRPVFFQAKLENGILKIPQELHRLVEEVKKDAVTTAV